MRTLSGLFLAVLLAAGLSAQNRGNGQPVVTGGPGNVVFPGGTAANNPGLTRVNPGAAYPGGGGPRLMIPGTSTRESRHAIPGTSYVYAYPIYVPFYDPSAYAESVPTPAPAQPAPNVVVIYASPPPAAPAVVETAHPSMQVYQPETAPAAEDASTGGDHYLFAFKDHSIYSAVAYWVDGDTLHYFTSGDTHKQAPLSTLDRNLTERLNRESGTKLNLPPAKE